MREAGMTVRRNALGNVVGTLPGKGPRKIVMGSHIDSVPNGGMFDGCLGVMAAIEAVHTLREQGLQLEHSVDVAAWAEEEGVVISGLMGSLAYCGLPLRPVQLEKMGQYGVTEADVAACRAEGPWITPWSSISSRAASWTRRGTTSALSAPLSRKSATKWRSTAAPTTRGPRQCT